MSYECVLTEVDGAVGVVTIHRPQVRNALNHQTIAELVDALESFDRNDAIRCMVLTGDDRAFAAGADIGEMAEASAIDVLRDDNFARWARFRAIHKPVIAAVSGYALGGGCELALMCDLVVASETALFGQPEVKIGIIPGAGGTQRWTRTAGKVRAMEAVLTGEPVRAVDAERMGLVNRVVPAGAQLEEAKRLANVIATRPPLAVRLGKEAVNQAMEVGLAAGLEFERKLFYLLFASEDKREGMKAFLEKRQGQFTGR
ncbi:MAG TPA: enoyl-CoA hydratase-related protein [Candidatus Dormibacteraeota bacterium]|jgi:enoyl-CoA hydratase|nr:enoyl-CoA hydratase-related protein [Candidatus Dormibacteraeota bacterium]